MDNNKDILRRRILIAAVKLPEGARMGLLDLGGGWQSNLSLLQANRLKPFEGRELEVGEIIRLGLSD